MKKQPRRMRILITVEVLSDETPEQPAEDAAQTDLSRFVRLEDLPSVPTPQSAPQTPAKPREGITPTKPPMTVENGRQPHLCYADGRKVHTCSRCGALGRRINHKTGRCGLRALCVTEAVGGISTAQEYRQVFNYGGNE